MQLNAMLTTTLKTAQAGQQMQAQQLNQQIAAQQLQNEIMAGRQAQQDSAGLVNALKELASLEAPSQKDVIGIISRQNLSPKAMGQFTELVGRTAPKEIKPATGAEADVQALVSEFSAVNGRPPNATEYRMMRQSVNAERKPSNVTNIGSGFAGQLFTDLNKKKSDLFALREVLANYDTAIDEVSKNGLFAGPGGELKFQGARALQSFGIDAYKTEAEAYQAAGSALANSTLSMARMLPGAFTENELIFLNDVVRGRERVPSLAALKQLRARFESRLQRQQKILDSEVTAFGEGAKDDPNIAIGYRILTAKPSADMPSLPPNF
jgi:hypothetical protein